VSRIFGPLRQLGYAVADIDAEMGRWIDLGVGPWFVEREVVATGQTGDGAPLQLRLAMAMANSGPVQLELIQPLDDLPSVYQAFLAAGRTGPQHWAVWPEEYDERVALLGPHGLSVAQEGATARGRFMYLVDPTDPLCCIEVAELTSERAASYQAVAEAAVDWDGRDPVRDGWP
jgi:hypothetical protein